MKRQATDWEKIFANMIKELYAEYLKNTQTNRKISLLMDQKN